MIKFLFRLFRGKAFRAEPPRESRVRVAASTVYTAGDQIYTYSISLKTESFSVIPNVFSRLWISSFMRARLWI